MRQALRHSLSMQAHILSPLKQGTKKYLIDRVLSDYWWFVVIFTSFPSEENKMLKYCLFSKSDTILLRVFLILDYCPNVSCYHHLLTVLTV